MRRDPSNARADFLGPRDFAVGTTVGKTHVSVYTGFWASGASPVEVTVGVTRVGMTV